jgi:hypothetical protein
LRWQVMLLLGRAYETLLSAETTARWDGVTASRGRCRLL